MSTHLKYLSHNKVTRKTLLMRMSSVLDYKNLLYSTVQAYIPDSDEPSKKLCQSHSNKENKKMDG